LFIVLRADVASKSGPDLLFSAAPENIIKYYLSTTLLWTASPQMFQAPFDCNYETVVVMQLEISHKTVVGTVGLARRVSADNNAPRLYDAILVYLQLDESKGIS
jgi:hypothetical protein